MRVEDHEELDDGKGRTGHGKHTTGAASLRLTSGFGNGMEWCGTEWNGMRETPHEAHQTAVLDDRSSKCLKAGRWRLWPRR